MVPVLIIMLVAMVPMIDTVAAELFTTLDTTTSVYFVNLIKLLVGSFVLVLVLGIIIKIVRSLQAPPEANYYDWS